MKNTCEGVRFFVIFFVFFRNFAKFISYLSLHFQNLGKTYFKEYLSVASSFFDKQITIWHIFSAEASCCHKMKFFRNSIRNAPYRAPNFIEWLIVKDLDIRNVKYCGSHLKFCFFHRNKENDISRGNKWQ